jgi:Ni,Fe-hydrogenase III small subunit
VTVWRRIARNLRDGTSAEPVPPVNEDIVRRLAAQLDATAQARLGHGLTLQVVNTGSCGGCELELRALNNVVYDLRRFGLNFVASPRQADVLLVTGPLTRNLREALERTLAATPGPTFVVAVGDCAVDGGVFKGSYAVNSGIAAAVPVHLTIAGCPPSPQQLLAGLRALLEATSRTG